MNGSSKTSTREAARGTYHVGAVLDGLLGVEGAVLPGDALADHAGALVDEHRRRGRGGGGRVATRVEEAGGGGAQHLGRAAGGGGHGDVLAWRRRVLLSFFSPLDSISFGARSTFLSFLGSRDPFLQEKLWGQTSGRAPAFIANSGN